jgi:hypothetical protein
LETDSWATGHTLTVLREAGGFATDDPAYQRDGASLPRTQFPDNGFPHGKGSMDLGRRHCTETCEKARRSGNWGGSGIVPA